MNEENLNKIVADIYTAYGSHTGYLFGILPENKNAVKAVVKIILDQKVKKSISKVMTKHSSAMYDYLIQPIGEDLSKELGLE